MAAVLVGAAVLRRVASPLVDGVLERPGARGLRLVVTLSGRLSGNLEHADHLFRVVVKCGRLTSIILNYLAVFVNERIFKCDNAFVACIVLTDIWKIKVNNTMPHGFDEL